MIARISLVIAIAVAALAVGVPAAFGEGRLAGSKEQSGVAYFYTNEYATLAAQPLVGVVSRPDSHEISTPFSYIDAVERISHSDAVERAARISSAPNRDVVLLSGDDHVTSQPVEASTPVASSNSGNDINSWQLGIGLGVGIALALGLVLGFRATRQRQLAH